MNMFTSEIPDNIFRDEDEVNYRIEPEEIPPATDSVDMLLQVVERWVDNPNLERDDVLTLIRALRSSRQPKGK